MSVPFLPGSSVYPDLVSKLTAVAYIGFAGTMAPAEVDQPIAICKEAITDP